MLTIAPSPDYATASTPLPALRPTTDPELQALVEAVSALDFAVALVQVPAADLGACEFCPDQDETGEPVADAVALIAQRSPSATRVHREHVCAGCAALILNRDHRNPARDLGAIADPDRHPLWIEIPGATA